MINRVKLFPDIIVMSENGVNQTLGGGSGEMRDKY